MPGGMAAFSIMDRQSGTVTWYFTPEASALAKAFGAKSCEKPEPVGGLALAVGDADSWDTHFPGYVPRLRDNP